MDVVGEGAARAAEALLKVCGGTTVLLRLAQGAAAGDPGEELGLATPGFHDVELRPCVWRRVLVAEGSAGELMVSGAAVLQLVGSLEFGSAELLFEGAAGVVVDGALLPITGVSAMRAAGEVVAWRLAVSARGV